MTEMETKHFVVISNRVPNKNEALRPDIHPCAQNKVENAVSVFGNLCFQCREGKILVTVSKLGQKSMLKRFIFVFIADQ